MAGLPGAGRTDISLSGILSRPWSLLSSRPPDVELPLPVAFDDEPVVLLGAARGFAELAAGSPVVEPRPLGPPLCATAVVRLLLNSALNGYRCVCISNHGPLILIVHGLAFTHFNNLERCFAEA
jgi:hypothetical protein